MRTNKLTVVVLGVFLLLGGASGNIMAGVNPGSFSLTPFVGGFSWDDDWNLDDKVTYGLAFGYNVTQNWGAEFMLNYLNTEDSRDNGDVDAYNYHIDALYHFRPDQKLVPYVAAGAGVISLDREKRTNKNWFALNLGVGLKWFLTDLLSLRGDVRWMPSFNPSRSSNFLYFLGLGFTWGGQ